MDDAFKGSCAILAATVCWAIGGGFFLRLLSSNGFSAVWAAVFSLLLAGSALYVYSKRKKLRVNASVYFRPAFVGLVFFNALHLVFAYASLQLVELGSFSVLQLFSVPLSAFAAWVFLKEKFSLKILAGIVLGVLGVFFVNGLSLSFTSQGIVLAVLSGFFIVATVILGRVLKEEFNSMLISKVFLASGFLLLPFAAFFYPFPSLTFGAIVLVLLVGFFDLVLGEFLKFYSLSKTPVRLVSVLELFQSVTFSLVGFFAFGEVLSSNVLAGGLLIGVSSLLVLS